MTAAEFNNLVLHDRIQLLLNEGVPTGKMLYSSYKIVLYSLQGFFVEVLYCTEDKAAVLDIKATESEKDWPCSVNGLLVNSC